MKSYTSILLLLCFFLLASSCKKNPEYIKVSPEMNAILNYKSGSYWIMKDSATNSLDSIVSFGIGTDSYGGGSKYQYQSLGIGLGEYQNNLLQANWGFSMDVYGNNLNVSYMLFTFDTNKNTVIYAPYLTLPINSLDFTNTFTSYPNYRPQVVNTNILTTYTINNQTFDSVYHLHYSFPGKTNVEDFYINKKVGLIKIVQDNEQIKRTLEVQKWNLVK